MLDIQSITQKNRDTFYDYSTGEKVSLARTRFVKLLLALFMAFVFAHPSQGFFGIIMASYSILIGFSFNVLFYLLGYADRYSQPKQQNQKHNRILEKELEYEKLGRLSRELFYNVSYFNVIAVALIILSLLYYLFQGTIFAGWWQHPPQAIDGSLFQFLVVTKSLSLHLYHFMLYLLLCESMYTFLRVVGRVNYYFNKKIEDIRLVR